MLGVRTRKIKKKKYTEQAGRRIYCLELQRGQVSLNKRENKNICIYKSRGCF